MPVKRWIIIVGLGILASGAGCVNCGYEVCKPVIDSAPYADAPLADRQHVYAFLINGVTPCTSSSTGLEGLRLQLAQRGWGKTYLGEFCNALQMAFEMHRVHRCDPAARFVLIGYDLGALAAVELGRHASKQGLPVDAVVLLDPVMAHGTGSIGCRVLAIRSGAGHADEASSVTIPDCGHWTLPASEKAVEAIGEIMKESASRVELLPIFEAEAPQFAEASPERANVEPPAGASPDWLFLNDQFGTHTRPLSPLPQWMPLGPQLP